MGQDEDAEPLVRRADFCRREETRRRRIAHAPKLSKHSFQPEADVTGDVFEEDPFGGTFPGNPGGLWPEVPRVVSTTAFACGAEGLAGISGEDGVEGAAKWPGIKAAQIVPDRGWGEIPGALGGDENSAGPVFPFNKGAGVITGLSEHEAQIKASTACAEG